MGVRLLQQTIMSEETADNSAYGTWRVRLWDLENHQKIIKNIRKKQKQGYSILIYNKVYRIK